MNMKSAANLFFLAAFSLLSPAHSLSQQDVCAINPKAIVSDACASYSTLERLNQELTPSLTAITKDTDFFAYYRLNLFNKECPFWNDANSMCGNIACAVTTLDNEEDVPTIWRAEELSKLEGPKAEHPGKKLQKERSPQKPLQGELGAHVDESCVVEYDDECDQRDYCVPEDESASAKGDYVSLVDNPERFTGYAGEGSAMVWNAIYRENCFSKASFPSSSGLGKSPFADNMAANSLKSVLFKPPQGGLQADLGFENEDECLEKRVFYRVISGMHASISTHICNEYLNQTTGLWSPNLACYKERLHQHPERIANLYFNYALVMRSIAKLGPYLKSYTFCSGDPAQDKETSARVQDFTSIASQAPPIFDESLMFVNGEGPSLKEDFKQRFRNVSRLMDCVGCDKCRLWGKVQTNGYGAALKVLFEFNANQKGLGEADWKPYLKRTELVALFNTAARLSSSITAVEKFRGLVMAEEDVLNQDQARVITDREKLPRHAVFGEDEERALSASAERESVRARSTMESDPISSITQDTIDTEPPSTSTISENDLLTESSAINQESSLPVVPTSKSTPNSEITEPTDDKVDSDSISTEDDFLAEIRAALAATRAQKADAPLSTMIWSEIVVVYRVFMYILKSYVRLPGILWNIFLIEASRLWERFVGLPVSNRTWSWMGRHRLDEL